MDKKCERCGAGVATMRSGARFCSTRCRVAAHRSRRRRIPARMTSAPRWIRHDDRKRPLRLDGRLASVTDPAVRSSYGEASTSSVGAGLGFILGDGFGCYDLDHCRSDGRLADWAVEFIRSIPEPVIFMEVSRSGEGVHVFVEAEESKGSRVGLVERYTRDRYIAVTGDVLTI